MKTHIHPTHDDTMPDRVYVNSQPAISVSRFLANYRFIANTREWWNLNMGNSKEKFIVWEHPSEGSTYWRMLYGYWP